MAPGDSLDRSSLNSMTVAELRGICKDRGLFVSGKKSELVDRISADIGEDDELIVGEEEVVEALIMEDDDTAESETEHSELIEEVLSRLKEEVVEAEVVGVEGEINDVVLPEERPPERTVTGGEDDAPSIVIPIPTLESMQRRWKTVAAVAAVAILVGALATALVQRGSGFVTEPLSFGDSMDFQVGDSKIEIEGDEMLELIKDSAGEILDEACGRLKVDLSGNGKVSIAEGQNSGAVETTDSLGRMGFLSAKKETEMVLDVDLEGKAQRSSGECGNLGWSLSDNKLSIETDAWVELDSVDVKRVDSSISFTDADMVTSNLRIVTYDSGSLGGIGQLASTLSFPLRPIELRDFFEDSIISRGASSTDSDIEWNSDWRWSVGNEYSHPSHGLVYPIEMEHEDIGRCYGHARMSLLVSKSVPWPVEQDVDIVLDKSLETDDCDFLVSTLSDELLPEGRLEIQMAMSMSSFVPGSVEIDWGRDYIKPNPGEDRPTSSTEQNWVDSMIDESEIRDFNLEAAKSCLENNHSTSDAMDSLNKGGYIWRAEWFESEGLPHWNLSWVDDSERSGWIILRGDEDGSGCDLTESASNSKGEVDWNSDIPATHPLSLLEERVLNEQRYPDLNQYIDVNDPTERSVWAPDSSVGYRLSVTEENQIISILPGDIDSGKVTFTASREWSENNLENSLLMAMDAETGEMIAWYHIES